MEIGPRTTTSDPLTHRDTDEAERKRSVPVDGPWAKDLGAIGDAASARVHLPSDAYDASPAHFTAVVHPERSFKALKPLTVEIFRLKAAAQAEGSPEIAAGIRMRIAMLQQQWVQMATSAGIPQPKGRLDPVTATPQEVAQAFMWSEAGGVIPRDELAADGGHAYLASVRDAVTARTEGFPALVDLHRDQPNVQRALLRRELARLGDSRPVADSDSIDALPLRRGQILRAKGDAAGAAELADARKQLYMGLDGFVGTGEAVEAYERDQKERAAIGETTTGSILASYLGHGDVARMRALGALGNAIEDGANFGSGRGGGTGHGEVPDPLGRGRVTDPPPMNPIRPAPTQR